MRDAVVVGGGIAGLAAAWSLRDLDVVVLERDDRVGGRLRSEARGPYWLNFGAHVFAGPGSETDALLRGTGVQALAVPGILTAVELEGRVVAGRRVETYPFRLPMSARDRLALARTGARLRTAVARYGRMLRDATQTEVLAFDGDRPFTDWLGAVPAAVDAVIRPTLQRSSAEPERLAAGYGVGYFHLVWDRSGGLARNVLGGSSRLAETIAAELGGRVRRGAHVERVAADADAVEVVDANGNVERARFAIVATPAHVTREIVEGLPSATADALGAIEYGRYVVAALRTVEARPAPWDSIYALSAARRSFNMLLNTSSVVRSHGAEREQGGTLMAYSGASLAAQLWDRDDARIADQYVAELDEIFPGTGAVVDEVVVHRWEHGLPYVFPGRHRLQAALEQPLGRVLLAGDYLGSRYTETAIASGRRAAAAVRSASVHTKA
jgi:protoporphyrinogen/coproporphyrinogen III oxidase